MIELKREIPLYEQIYQNISKLILEREMDPGERLIDTNIAKKFNVSRAPVREAFRKLEQDGLVINNKGVITILTPSLEDALELYQVRIGLESIAAYLAAELVTEDEINEIEQTLIETEKALRKNDRSKVISLNTIFHEQIFDISKNERLIMMLDNIRSLNFYCRNTIIKHYNREESFLKEHYEVFEAIKSKNPEEAERVIKKHIRNEMDFFKQKYMETTSKENNNWS
ncbi:GntR family transcriptional regulator [Bacillus sp. FJAT-50079]|uniref:GntR family transcriptional regulator n=1 Tax=Bacillus sp. FJAT-50079 TaxID=2833577 RepID=UPI001BC967C8|nr:GntR family transcriptional regulator [Bacillus sp. FJAT-50079]MBS4206631.1 GntR family transcriptional regulator [Bacillus sp. FJAT-50079]